MAPSPQNEGPSKQAASYVQPLQPNQGPSGHRGHGASDARTPPVTCRRCRAYSLTTRRRSSATPPMACENSQWCDGACRRRSVRYSKRPKSAPASSRRRARRSTSTKLLRMEPDGGTTNVRNTASAHWKRWLGVESRCVVPLTSFSEFDHGAKQDVWFSLSPDRPLAFFAGSGRHNGPECARSGRAWRRPTYLLSSRLSRTARSARSPKGYASHPDRA